VTTQCLSSWQPAAAWRGPFVAPPLNRLFSVERTPEGSAVSSICLRFGVLKSMPSKLPVLVSWRVRPQAPDGSLCVGRTLAGSGCGERADGRRESRRERGAPDTGFR
jgi:hypothetical protein